MRLIDADDVIEEIKRQAGCAECDSYNGIRCKACTWDDAIVLVDDFADNHPVTGQPEIVRCRDCRHVCGRGHGMYCQFIECGISGAFHKEDWFCADGERKD